MTMTYVTREEIGKLAKDPISFAIMMDDHQMEHVIAEFVSVLNQRIKDRGG